jgi:very-short-patch-repair endonuclease
MKGGEVISCSSKRIDPRHTGRARRLRAEATPQERALWSILSPYRPRFTRQFTVEPYTADFACRQAKLLIELDGSQHAGSSHDEHRTRFLNGLGWTVLRFWNSEVNTNADGIAEAILAKVQELTGITPEAKPPRKRNAGDGSPP